MPDEIYYWMVVDLWIYRDGTIGFSNHPKRQCDCTKKCKKNQETISACFDAQPIRLCTQSEYLKAREKTINSNISFPLPNKFLPSLDPGDIILLKEGLFFLGQNIEIIPLTSEQKKELLRNHPGDNDKFLDYCLTPN